MLAVYLHANRGLEASNPYLIVPRLDVPTKRPSGRTQGWWRNASAEIPEREHLSLPAHQASVHRPAQPQSGTWQGCAFPTASDSPAGCARFRDASSAVSSRSPQSRAAKPGSFAESPCKPAPALRRRFPAHTPAWPKRVTEQPSLPRGAASRPTHRERDAAPA